MRVAGINRYPVKSLQGERLTDVAVDPTGLDGDRRWGIVDRQSGKVLSAKRHGRLLEGSAVTTPDGPLVTLPGGVTIEPGDPACDDTLSRWLDADVTLQTAAVEDEKVYEVSLQLNPDVDVFDMPMTPGRYLDLSPVHVLTTASLRAAADEHPDGDWTPDRFRPSILVEVDDDSFVENEWVGQAVRLGSVTLDIVLPTVRCVMTTRAQPPRDIERDVEVFTTLKTVNQQNLGVYANVSEPGTISLGDSVALQS